DVSPTSRFTAKTTIEYGLPAKSLTEVAAVHRVPRPPRIGGWAAHKGNRIKASGGSNDQTLNVSVLRKRIVWISGIDKTGGADSQKSFHFIHGLGNYVVWLAAVELGLQLNKSVIRSIEPVGQHGGDVEDRHRVLFEKSGRVSYVKLRALHGAHVR